MKNVMAIHGKRNKSSSAADIVTKKKNGGQQMMEFTDSRPEAAAQRKRNDMLQTPAHAGVSVSGMKLAGITIQRISDHPVGEEEAVRNGFERYLGEQLRGTGAVSLWARMIFEDISGHFIPGIKEHITPDTLRSGIAGKIISLAEFTKSTNDLDTNVNKVVKLINLEKRLHESMLPGMAGKGNVLAEARNYQQLGMPKPLPFDFKPWELEYRLWPAKLLRKVGEAIKPVLNGFFKPGGRIPGSGEWHSVTRNLPNTEPVTVRGYLEETWPDVHQMLHVLTSVGYAWSEEVNEEPVSEEYLSLGTFNPRGMEYRQAYAGEQINILNPANLWIQEAWERGMPLISGPSGTSLRYLEIYYRFGSPWRVGLQEARLVVLANLLPPSQHHSYHEIMTASLGIGGLGYSRFNYSDMQAIEPARTIAKNYLKLHPGDAAILGLEPPIIEPVLPPQPERTEGRKHFESAYKPSRLW